METRTRVRAIHQDGALKLLTPLELPEGTQVNVIVLQAPQGQTDQAQAADLVYPTRLVSAERLDSLTGLIAIGGDALTDSEALYD
jgi:predicted DNA-binding antitoxin AbrB/MazE fold protein